LLLTCGKINLVDPVSSALGIISGIPYSLKIVSASEPQETSIVGNIYKIKPLSPTSLVKPALLINKSRPF
jgi:hypothetical protein